MPRIQRYPTYLGVDPGASGGIAMLSGGEVETYPMPGTMQDVWAVFESFGSVGGFFAVIEQVGGYVGEAQPGSSAFTFGKSYGSLLMALTAAQIPYEEVIPRTWQKVLGITPRGKGEKCGTCVWVPGYLTDGAGGSKRVCPTCKGKKRTGGETKTAFKNRLKAKAQQLFPSQKVTLGTADSLLIAEFCKRKREGKLT